MENIGINHIIALMVFGFIIFFLYKMFESITDLHNLINLKKAGIKCAAEVVGKTTDIKDFFMIQTLIHFFTVQNRYISYLTIYYINIKFIDSINKYHAKQIQCSEDNYFGTLPETFVNIVYLSDNPNICDLEDNVYGDRKFFIKIATFLMWSFFLVAGVYKFLQLLNW